MSEYNPLVERVDALLKRHQQQATRGNALEPVDSGQAPPAGDGQMEPLALTRPVTFVASDPPEDGDETDIPVLTEVVDPDAAPPAPNMDALGAQIEAAVLEKLLAELDLALDRRLGRSIGELLEQVQDSLRAELSLSVRQMVRDAVVASIAKALEERARDL